MQSPLGLKMRIQEGGHWPHLKTNGVKKPVNDGGDSLILSPPSCMTDHGGDIPHFFSSVKNNFSIS